MEADRSADATSKAYHDREKGEFDSKKDEMTTEIRKLSIKIDKMTTSSTQLKDEVSILQKNLANLLATRAVAGKMRNDESAAFAKDKVDTQHGLDGAGLGAEVLRDYCATDDQAHASANAESIDGGCSSSKSRTAATAN